MKKQQPTPAMYASRPTCTPLPRHAVLVPDLIPHVKALVAALERDGVNHVHTLFGLLGALLLAGLLGDYHPGDLDLRGGDLGMVRGAGV